MFVYLITMMMMRINTKKQDFFQYEKEREKNYMINSSQGELYESNQMEKLIVQILHSHSNDCGIWQRITRYRQT